MPYFARLWGRDSRRRPAPARYALEALEDRTMLSGTAGSVSLSSAVVSSATVLTSSLNTAVTGSKIVFTASIENAATDAPIGSGKVNFVVQSPQKIVLGHVNVNKQGQASIATSNLTNIGTYRVQAQYTPTVPQISASVASTVKVKVIPVPLNVPTTTTLVSGSSLAEAGQYVSLVATVTNAGTDLQTKSGLVEPITGSVAFVTDTASPLVLGEVTLNALDQASLSTNMLANPGSYPIKAEFLPANNYFATSTSVPTAVTITPSTANAATGTTLQLESSSIETGEPIQVNVTVQNSNTSLADGVVELVTVSRHPQVLGSIGVSSFGQQVSFTSFKLKNVGSYQIQAKYIPKSNRFAASTSAPVTVTITPLTAASFRVTPVVVHGHLGGPLSFNVTALNAENHPLTTYTSTVVFSSPTDSWTIFPASEYRALHSSPPSLQSPGLASFTPQSYTFTPADRGSHTFLGAVTFGKGGAENVQVTQANNSKVFGKATFAIG